MKIAHWVKNVGSGMRRVAESLVNGEKAMGLDSAIVYIDDPKTFLNEGIDIHVVHTHLTPEALFSMKSKFIYVAHGTPETCFTSAVNAGQLQGYGHGDSWMLAQFWLQNCDATVTFWPRHQAIWKSLCDKNTPVYCIPMGMDTVYWSPQETKGKYVGEPSLFSAENNYQIKWPLDLLIAWPWVVSDNSLYNARLHIVYIPTDSHRWFFPLVNRNGSSFFSYLTGRIFDDASLKNAFASTDYYIGLVRYGDYNHICLQAKSCGAKVISYRGNPYADYWITEGDQRTMAEEIRAILKNEVSPRETEKVPTIEDMVNGMGKVYEDICRK